MLFMFIIETIIMVIKGMVILWAVEWFIKKISKSWKVHYYMMNISIWLVMFAFVFLGVPSLMPANFLCSIILQLIVVLAYKKDVMAFKNLMNVPPDLRRAHA